jgi:hypothetical protein
MPTPFDQLTPLRKVQAVLGSTKQPLSQYLAITLTGIDFEDLSEEEKRAIDQLFVSELVVVKQSPQYGQQYQLAANSKKALTEIDWKSAQKHLNSLLKGSLFG